MLAATSFWGLGFVATVIALRAMSPGAVIVTRFSLAALAGTAIYFLFLRKSEVSFWQEFKLSFLPGVCLGATLLFQTFGLLTSTATKSAFITTLYVLIVPFFAAYWFRHRVTGLHVLAIFCALLGTVLLVQLDEFALSLGDVLLFANAFTAAFHILATDRVVERTKDAFLFNSCQALWCALISLPFVFIGFRFQPEMVNLGVLWSLASLAFGSSLLGFFLQVRAQKYLSPTAAAVLFLLEAPLSAAFAYMLLEERLNSMQIFGAAMISVAALTLALSQSSRKLLPTPDPVKTTL